MRKAVLLAALAAAAPRLFFAVQQYHRYLPQAEPEEGYFEMAAALFSGSVFSVGVPRLDPQPWRGPIYPVFGAVTQVGLERPEPGRILLGLAAAGAAAAALAFVLGSALVSPLGGALAALGVALEPQSIVAGINVHTFYAYVLLVVAATAAWWAASPTPRRSLVLGFVLGASLSARGAHFPLPLLLAFFAPWRASRLMLLAMALTLAPMAARNWARFGQFTPLPDVNGGAVSLLAAAAGERGLGSCTVERAIAIADGLEPGFRAKYAESDRLHPELLNVARRRILRDPLEFTGRFLVRLYELWLGLPLVLALFAWYLVPTPPMRAAALTAVSLSGYAVAGGAPEHQAAGWPLLLALAGCALAAPLGRRPETSRLRLLPAGAAALGGLYAAFLHFLAGESLGRARDDEKYLAAVSRAAAGYRDTSVGRPRYERARADVAHHRAHAGDCAYAVPLLKAVLPTAAYETIRALKVCEAVAERDCRLAVPAMTASLRKGEGKPSELVSGLALCGVDACKKGWARREARSALAAVEQACQGHLLAQVRRGSTMASASRLLELATGNPLLEREAYLRRGSLHESQGRQKEAEADFRRAGSAADLAAYLARRGRRLDALAALRGRADAASRAALWALSGGREGDLEQAVASDAETVCGTSLPLDRAALPRAFFDRCLEARPKDGRLWKDRGIARFLAGDKEGARADLERALALAPDDEETRMTFDAIR